MDTTRAFPRAVAFFAAWIVLAGASAWAQDRSDASAVKEADLLKVLRSDAPAADKAITCKLLAIHGSSAAVPDLARLLPDPQFSSWARIALEAIPGPEADEALRKATESLDGLLLVGTINSIGVRRDVEAVGTLAKRLQDRDPEVASAAAVALGHIANAPATQSLREALAAAPDKVRSAIAEALVLCAEQLHADDKSAEAVAIYDEVRKADVPKQRVIEATRGAILARGQEGIPLLIEQLRSDDKARFRLALSTAREFPGGEFDKALADELPRATPERAALIIQAMADRPTTVVLTAVLSATEKGTQQVRLSAVDALARVGDASCVSTLLAIAIDDDEDLAATAKEALASLPGEKVDAQIAALLPKSQGKAYPLLIELVGRRRIEAVPELLKALDHSDAAVRSAALAALGETVSLKRMSVLVEQVVSPQHADDAPAALQALKAASVRMPDREACAAELAQALDRSPAAKKGTLLEILSDVGGTKALQTLAAAAKSDDPQLQDDASRLLGKWNGLDAAPVLLDLAKTAPEARYQVRALRGYIGLARKFDMSDQQRAEMCQKALDASRQAAEQTLVLDVLTLHPSAEGLTLAIQAMKVPQLNEEATQATLVIAQKLGGKVDVSELLANAGIERVKLEIVKAEYGAGSTQKDVTAILRKHVGDLPLIALPSASYNASFGGDPVPGSVKQLKIQYRINGKAGDASFAEDALIILPSPK